MASGLIPSEVWLASCTDPAPSNPSATVWRAFARALKCNGYSDLRLEIHFVCVLGASGCVRKLLGLFEMWFFWLLSRMPLSTGGVLGTFGTHRLQHILGLFLSVCRGKGSGHKGAGKFHRLQSIPCHNVGSNWITPQLNLFSLCDKLLNKSKVTTWGLNNLCPSTHGFLLV